jgi:integrase
MSTFWDALGIGVDVAGAFFAVYLDGMLDGLLDSGVILGAQGQRVSERGGSLARTRFQIGSLMLLSRSWVARWREDVVGSDGTVRRVRKSQVIGTLAQLPTKKLARRRLELLLARVNAPEYRPARVSTLAEFAEHWRAKILSQRKPSTQKSASVHLGRYILPQLGRLRLDQLTLEAQQTFVAQLAMKLSRKSVLNVASTLSAMLNTAKAWGYVTEGMSIKRLSLPPRKERPRRRFFTAQEVRGIVEAAPEPYSTIYLLAAMTGMRSGEIFGLKVEDLDFEGRTISVRRAVWKGKLQSLKSRSSERVLHLPEPLTRRLKAYLQTWRPNPEQLLFTSRAGTPMDSEHILYRKLYPLLDRLGIERGGLHAFRHTHSTLLIEAGASISVAQSQLGHADSRVTLDVYTHVLPESQRRAVDRIAEILDRSGLTATANVN